MFSIKRWFLWQLKFFLLRIIKKTKFKANWRSIVTNSKVGNNCDVGCSDLNEVTLGDYSYINSGKCYLANIGKFCSIGRNVKIGGFATHPLYKGYENLMRLATIVYEDLIAANVAPEQARFALPQAMYTEWYWTGSLAAYARFYKQRIDEHAQWEIQEYAEAVGKIIQPAFPVS